MKNINLSDRQIRYLLELINHDLEHYNLIDLNCEIDKEEIKAICLMLGQEV